MTGKCVLHAQIRTEIPVPSSWICSSFSPPDLSSTEMPFDCASRLQDTRTDKWQMAARASPAFSDCTRARSRGRGHRTEQHSAQSSHPTPMPLPEGTGPAVKPPHPDAPARGYRPHRPRSQVPPTRPGMPSATSGTTSGHWLSHLFSIISFSALAGR